MADLKPVNGVARCVVQGTLSTVPVVNVFHIGFDSPKPFTQNQIDGLAVAVRAGFVARFIPLITALYTCTDVTCTDLSSDTGVVGIQTGSTVGGKSSSTLPANMAACITWKIPRHYRGGHPRTYLPPPTGSDTTNANTWQAAFITSMTTAAEGFRTDVGTAVAAPDTVHLVCVHRYKGYTVNPANGKKTPIQLDVPLVDIITKGTFDSRIDSQRRRLGRDR